MSELKGKEMSQERLSITEKIEQANKSIYELIRIRFGVGLTHGRAQTVYWDRLIEKRKGIRDRLIERRKLTQG